MTQDVNIILTGLHCCSRTNPDCDNCPFVATEVHCRELDSDAEKVIKSLSEQVKSLTELLNNKEELLKAYEDMITDVHENLLSNKYVEALNILNSTVEQIEVYNAEN